MQHSGVFDVKFYFLGRLCHGAFVVSPSLRSNSILGINIMKTYNMTLDPATHNVTMHATEDIATISHGDSHLNYLIQVAHATTIEPGTSQRVRCRLIHPESKKPLLEARQFIAEIDNFASFLMVSSDHGAFRPHISNTDVTCRQYDRGDIIGHSSPIHDVHFISDSQAVDSVQAGTPVPRAHTDEEKKKIRLELMERLQSSNVPYSVRPDYLEMLSSYEDVFSAAPLDLGLTDIVEHGIELKDNTPAYKGQFRLAYDQLRLIKDNIIGWVKAGLVSRGSSKFNSPVFCVPKKEGKGLRVVLDYRSVNEKSLPDKYSIRTIDQCLEEIGRANSKIFSCFDLTNGFWQLKLADNASPYTAFTIPGLGQFQWKVTPQGLMGAPASFSRLMDLIMVDTENIITYIDDILIHSRSHKEHIAHIRVALSRLRSAHLRLNPGKCIFAATSVQYLGHTISSDGVTPGRSKTDAVDSCLPPTSIKQLKSFLGLANYFRQFIKNFARRAAPLFRLTRKDSTWDKSSTIPPDAMRAFEDIKKAICSRPLLAYPTSDQRLILTVDAAQGDARNSGGMGACLLQRQPNGSIKPIGYASRQLLSYEENYPPFLLEMDAAVFGMEYFHHYLVGRRFTLLTDHKPIVPLSVTHSKTLNRLQLKMQDMHPDVGYIKGEDNVISDFLTRYKGFGISRADISDTAGISVNAVDLCADSFLPRQQEDELCKTIFAFLKDKPWRKEGHYYTPLKAQVTLLPRGCVGIKPPSRQGHLPESAFKAIAPKAMITPIIKEAHNSRIGGHDGQFRTLERIREMVWWPSMDKDIKDHIARCPVCGANPSVHRPTPAPASRLPPCRRLNQRIHIDLYGPMDTPSKAGNRYVMVYTDAFTRLTRLVAIKDKQATTVAKALMQWFYLYGIPEQIHSDQGKEFCNEMMQVLCRELDIDHSTTTPYHPQCNAAAERFNRTMTSFLKKAIADAGSSTLDWELYLGPLMLSYNSGINKATRVTPFYATFGYNPATPLWSQDFGESGPVANHDYASDLAKLRHAQHAAHKLIFARDQRSRRSSPTDEPRTFTQFSKHDRVWVKINADTAPNPKLNQDFEPGIILTRSGDATYKVLRHERRRRKQKTINISQLIPRTSAHADDDRFPLIQDNSAPPDTPTRRSPRVGRRPDYHDADSDDEDSPHTAAVITSFINEVSDTNDIAHLIPAHARSLPLLDAAAYINADRFTSQDVVDLLLRGWFLCSKFAATPTTSNSARPSVSRALARLADHNAPGRRSTDSSFSRKRSTRSTLTKGVTKALSKISKALSPSNSKKAKPSPDTHAPSTTAQASADQL